jgi:spore maturation protein CgeB
MALWYPDDPRFFSSLTAHIAPYYDIVFTSSRRAINLYKSISVNNVYRLPFACDPEVHKGTLDPQNLIRRALFIGTYSTKRYSFIRKLVRLGVPIDIIGPNWPFPFDKYVVGPSTIGSTYTYKIQSYSVILNIHQNLAYGPNMRTFEVTGSGGALLSDRAEDITDFFSEGNDMLVYDTLEDAAYKIKYLIENPDVSFKMSYKGQKKCYLNNTYDDRVREILKLL